MNEESKEKNTNRGMLPTIQFRITYLTVSYLKSKRLMYKETVIYAFGLYGDETWCHKKSSLSVCNNRVLREILGPQTKYEAAGET